MPNFSASSLNKAWPLYQGAPGLGLTNSSTPYARCCSNPNCDATTKTAKSWGWLPTEKSKTQDNVLCMTCLAFWRRKGKMRNANHHAYKLKTGRAAKVYICSNPLCGSDKVDKNWGFWDGFEGRKDINSILCRQCRVHANNYNGAMRDPATTAHKGKAIPKDRECSNPNCNATAADTEHWGRWNGLTEEKDESNILCGRCLTCKQAWWRYVEARVLQPRPGRHPDLLKPLVWRYWPSKKQTMGMGPKPIRVEDRGQCPL